MVEVVALPRTLSDARKYRESTVGLGYVVDELHDYDGLPDARAPERPHLAAFEERADEVDGLDAGFQNFRARALLQERRGLAVYRQPFGGRDGALLVYRIPRDVENPTEGRAADRHLYRGLGVDDFVAAL